MKTMRSVLACASLIALTGATAAAFAQARGGAAPAATYWMTAETTSGMAAGMGGGNAAAMMSALRGRSSHTQSLMLQLGSGRRAAGTPEAEHLPPVGLKAGPSLPLVSPQGGKPAPATNWSGSMEKPKGRMLIYWGCGDRARPGQPLVIDFAAMASGKMPAAFANNAIRPMTPPSPASHATYGEWPNARSQTRVPTGGSLVGEHVVRGNYSPEIRFTLGAGQDFLAPVTLTSKTAAASGSVPLVWRPVSGARAWFAATMGAASNGDFVMWSSSETQAAAMAFDHVSDSDLSRLVANRTLMPASADRCTIPAEVAKAAPQSMLTLAAFGGESNFTQPRPAGSPASWRPEWSVKLRTKSTHMAMLGMDMDDFGGDDEADEAEDEQPKKKKSKLRRGLEGIMGQ